MKSKYTIVAPGILIVLSLFIGQNSYANYKLKQTDIAVPISPVERTNTVISHSKKNVEEQKKEINFHGSIKSKKGGKPIENAMVTFITTHKIISGYTSKDGSFSFIIPSELLELHNVINVSYNEITNESRAKKGGGFISTEYIISEDDISSNFKIKADEISLLMGRLAGHYSEKAAPVVYNNGVEMSYTEFEEVRKDEDFSYKNKDYFYFESEAAVVLSGAKAIDGLYLLFDKAPSTKP